MGRVVIPGFRKIETSGGGEGTGNYNDLANKPSINNVPLVGNLKTVDLKLTDSTLTEEGIPAEAKEVGLKLEAHSTSLTALKKETVVNLLKTTLETTSQNGVTCTNNGDGTYTLDGAASANAEFTLHGASNLVELNKEFRLTGCPKNTDAYLVVGDWGSPWTIYGTDRGNGSNFKITTSSPDKRVVISVPEGATMDNIVFKPMITTNLDATYDDFVPYTGDTGKINSDVASLLKRIEALEALTTKTDTDTTVTE